MFMMSLTEQEKTEGRSHLIRLVVNEKKTPPALQQQPCCLMFLPDCPEELGSLQIFKNKLTPNVVDDYIVSWVPKIAQLQVSQKWLQ